MRLKTSILILLAISAVLAYARPRPTTMPRVRQQQTTRDRTPKVRLRTPQVRQR